MDYKYINRNENNHILFDSDFENGNLDLVFEYKPQYEYDLYLRVDSNTRGHSQWYFYSVVLKSNTQQNQKIKMNIMNMTKLNSLYNKG